MHPTWMCTRVPLSLQKVQESGGVCEPHQMHTCAHSSLEEPPTNIPRGLWNQSSVQTGPSGFLIFLIWQHVPPLSVRLGHQGKELDSMKHRHVQMFSGHGLEVDQLDIVQLVQVAHQGLVRLVGHGPADEFQR